VGSLLLTGSGVGSEKSEDGRQTVVGNYG